MYDVSQEYINALADPVKDYKLKIYIDDVEYDESIIVANSLSITNQCSEADIVQIGSVYCAEMKCIIAHGVIPRNTWKGSVIRIYEGMDIGLDENDEPIYEYVPLGILTVNQADHTDDGVQIVADDDMLLFDKNFNLSTTIGNAYSILSMICQDCGVTLGMTEQQIEAMSNGSMPLALYSENDCETYRDVLFWIAQLLTSFAIIGRDGKLYLREYKSSSNITREMAITERFEGSSFSDFVTEYSGVGFTDIDSQEYIYVSDGADDKLTYNLGANPFMQYGTDSTRKQMALNILNKLKRIHYVPFKTGYLNTPAYDLGDVFQNNGGIAEGAVSCVMWYEYNYSSGYMVEGFGQNPALATARDKVDKELAGIMSKTNKDTLQFYTFKNAQEHVIEDGNTEQIIYIRFTTMESKQVVFQAEILCDADITLDDIKANILYYLDGALITDYKPTETWSEDGKHIISLYYVINVEPNTLYRWQVMLNAAGGEITIPVENARGTIWGQGLVASEKWDGYIDLEDTFSAIELDSISVSTFTDTFDVDTVIPHSPEAEDEFSAISIEDNIDVAEFVEVVYVNKTSLFIEGYTWADLLEMDWGEVLDNHLW